MAHVEKRGPGRWRARYRGPDGRERSQTFARRVDAERWLAGVTVSTAKGEWIDPALGRVTFAEWTERWAPTIVDLRPNTLSRDLGMVRTHLIPAFGPVPLAKLTTVDVAAWVAAQTSAGRLAPATVRKAGQILAKIMRSAVDSGLIARSPCTSVKLPAEGSREMRFLSPAELIALVDAIDEHYRVLVLTAAHAGLRWGELAGLRVARVDPLRRTVTVTEQLTELDGRLSFGPPKTAASRRSVSLPSFLVQALSEQIGGRAEPGPAGLVFPAPVGGPMRRSNFRRRAWLPATQRAGLDGLRFHDLRHTAVALAIAQGGHAKAIQERMGHSSVTVTLDRYGHLFEGLDERIAERLDAMWRDALAASPRPGRGLEVLPLARSRT